MSATLTWPPKDPDEVIDFQVDHSGRIPSTDSIVQSSWVFEPPGELIGTLGSHSGRKTTIWLSGGVEGSSYAVTNSVVTADGRELDQTVYIVIQTR